MATKSRKAGAAAIVVSGVPEGADPRGLKRLCPACGVKFYDFWLRPAPCPACATSFTPQTGGRSARATARLGVELENKAALVSAAALATDAEGEEEGSVLVDDEAPILAVDDDTLEDDGDDDGDEGMGLGIHITEGEEDI